MPNRKPWLMFAGVIIFLAGLALNACGRAENQVSPTANATPAVMGTPTPQPSPDRRLPAPPTQPATGLGGKDYPHATLKQTVYGSGADQYTIFEPTEPTPKSAPVVIFLHGYLGINPRFYYAWVEHLTRRGNIVVYPAYQTFGSNAEVFQPAMFRALTDAFGQLRSGKHITPELDKVTAVGHSLGGMLSVALAARAGQDEVAATIPRPKAIMPVEPGDCAERCVDANGKSYTRADYSKISPDTKMLLVVGDRDDAVGDSAAKYVWNNTPQIPLANKDFITVVSDEYGSPRLIADHYLPTGTNPNALSFYGTWKLFDALHNCTLYGKDCETALGNTPQQRFMGKWSDGRPVNELIVTKKP
jgi:acetyl esterase/lipase